MFSSICPYVAMQIANDLVKQWRTSFESFVQKRREDKSTAVLDFLRSTEWWRSMPIQFASSVCAYIFAINTYNSWVDILRPEM